MKVVILAGGKGTRLSEETVNLPKPMDTLRDMHELNDLWNGGKAPWKVW
jgi:hypothetical protein